MRMSQILIAMITSNVNMKFFAPCCYTTVSSKKKIKKSPELSCHWVDFVYFVCQKNSVQIWVHHSQSGSNNDLRRLEVSQRLLLLQGICIRFGFLEGSCCPGRTEWYVPDPGEGGKVSTEAKWKIVDLPALQGVAGVALMGLVPGQDAAFMLRTCWMKVVKPQFYHSQNNLVHRSLLQSPEGEKNSYFPISYISPYPYKAQNK